MQVWLPEAALISPADYDPFLPNAASPDLFDVLSVIATNAYDLTPISACRLFEDRPMFEAFFPRRTENVVQSSAHSSSSGCDAWWQWR